MSDVCGTTLFDNFLNANTFKGILNAFNQICADFQLDPGDYEDFYPRLRSCMRSQKAEKLWALLDERAAQREYKNQKACQNLRVLIIGAGPCGLRLAIECALLGCKVVILEKRDQFSRNNVLHFWPFVIHDLRALGAKIIHPRFCSGTIDHLSIRKVQVMLSKVALLLGVEIHANVSFLELEEPAFGQDRQLRGWKAKLSPSDHHASDYEFDVIVGAEGKHHTVPGFRRKEFRGKLAIAITANFVNRRTQADEKISEQSGVAFVYKQQFFKDMHRTTGIDLENIVYYKDETHYFVMTVKKLSLLQKGVLKRDSDDIRWLLGPENVNQEALLNCVREAADYATEGALPRLDFALTYRGHPDVAMFDFTSLFSAEYSCLFTQRFGHRLLMGIVGDSLHEPFWPTGSGCARGFLGVFDAAWMIRQYYGTNGPMTIGEVLAERETSYRLLAQTTSENLSKNYAQYTIDPRTRYPRFESTGINPMHMRYLVDTDNPAAIDGVLPPIRHGASGCESSHNVYVRHNRLIRWYQSAVAIYRIRVDGLTASFRNGSVLLAAVRRYCPNVLADAGIDDKFFSDFDPSQSYASMAYEIVQTEFGINPPSNPNDRNAMYEYLSELRAAILERTPVPASLPLTVLREFALAEQNAEKLEENALLEDSTRGQELEEQREDRLKRHQQMRTQQQGDGPTRAPAGPSSGYRNIHRPANVGKVGGSKLKDMEKLFFGKK